MSSPYYVLSGVRVSKEDYERIDMAALNETKGNISEYIRRSLDYYMTRQEKKTIVDNPKSE
jgi:Tfp pilus assembly PilM family ATPase